MSQKNILRHFSKQKTLKCGTKSDHERLQYSFQMPCGICKWMNEKNKNPFHWSGWVPSVRRTSVLSTSTNLETWIKCLVLWKVEGDCRGWQGHLLSTTYIIFSSKNSVSCLTTHTYCKTWHCPKLCLQTLINLTFCESFQSFMQKNSRHLLRNWL